MWLQDKDSVFYRQKRCGKDRKVFTVLKFRTMTLDAERLGPAWQRYMIQLTSHSVP
ncbi:MAG: sugar transferase [Candidatus Omnitrophota bacterium]|nr:MAG: sugar transferase [Candidatus Omnitrophota bacterium]